MCRFPKLQVETGLLMGRVLRRDGGIPPCDRAHSRRDITPMGGDARQPDRRSVAHVSRPSEARQLVRPAPQSVEGLPGDRVHVLPDEFPTVLVRHGEPWHGAADEAEGVASDVDSDRQPLPLAHGSKILNPGKDGRLSCRRWDCVDRETCPVIGATSPPDHDTRERARESRVDGRFDALRIDQRSDGASPPSLAGRAEGTQTDAEGKHGAPLYSGGSCSATE